MHPFLENGQRILCVQTVEIIKQEYWNTIKDFKVILLCGTDEREE